MLKYRENASEQQRLFADRLRAFRQRYSLTQRDLANRMALDRLTIVYLENCYERPWPDTVRKFGALEAKYAKVEEAELEGLEGMS